MKEAIYTYEQLPLMLCADQIAALLGISRANAYNLMHQDDFPSIHIGKRLIVPREKLIAWIDRQSEVDGQKGDCKPNSPWYNTHKTERTVNHCRK